MKRTLRNIGWTAGVFVATGIAMASDFEVQGYVEVIPADEAGNLLSAAVERSQFKLTVWDDKWLLQSTTADGNCDLCGSDGANAYWLATQTNIPGAAVAEVASGQYPLGPNTIWVSLPWLTFASSHYLDSPDRSTMPVPWGFPRTDPTAFIFSAEVRRLALQPRLPEEITFRVSGPLLKAAPRNPLLEIGELNRQARDRNAALLARYAPGFVGGRYTVLATTNWNGMRLPSEAALTRYSVTQPTSRVPFELYRLKAESVSAPRVGSYLPGLPARIMVQDRRFRSPWLRIDSLQYPIADGRWRSQADPQLRSMFGERKRTAAWRRLSDTLHLPSSVEKPKGAAAFSSPGGHSRPKKMLAGMVLGLLLVGAIVALALRRIRVTH